MGKTKRKQETYIVALPEAGHSGTTGIDRSAYLQIPRFGKTKATTPASAVSYYIMRKCPEMGALIIDILSKREGGLEGLAFHVPDEYFYGDGKPASAEDKRITKPYFLALEIALIKGKTKPDKLDIDAAFELMKH